MRLILPKILFFLLFSTTAIAQKNNVVSGRIISSDKDAIISATIHITELNRTFSSDSLGYYSINLPSASYTFKISAVGMSNISKKININKSQVLNFTLTEDQNNLAEVIISSKTNERSLSTPQMGAERLNMKTINIIPIIFGERDILKAIQLLPGIKSAGEGGAGFYVRGGSADQNLIMMDEVPVYNASHLLGFFSTFNPDAVEDITVYKTGMPAQFGGRLSSVLDIKMKAPDNDHLTATGGIGLISSKLTLQGPIKKEASSFLISARRTYVDALLRLSPDSNINQNIMYFYDLNARLDFTLNPRTKLSLTGYLGSDKLGLSNTFGITWGNKLASGQLKHIFSKELSSTTTASFSNYQSKINIKTGTNDFQIFSEIRDLALRQNFLWQQRSNNMLRFGFSAIYHTVKPGEITASQSSNLNPTFYQERYSLENAVFATDDWQLSPKLNASFGLRLNGFSLFGPGNFLTVDENGNITSTDSYAKGQLVKTYLNLEPRLSVSYLINDLSSLKASYVRNSQNLHMVANSTSTNPTDKWLSSTKMIKPEFSDQYAIGYYRNLFANSFELNIESYYKTMANQIDYRDGADVFNSDAVETQLLYGIGRAYGLEFLFKKTSGNFTGWLSYTLSKTERKINGINNGNWYNARQDRTHDIALVGTYQLNKKWTLSATWIYYTGDAVTFPSGKYFLDGRSFFYYTSRNAYRMPSYHRLDLGANLLLKKSKKFTSELSLSLYNAYGRKNAYAINFREVKNNPDQTEIIQTTLFKFLPSISYNFKFL